MSRHHRRSSSTFTFPLAGPHWILPARPVLTTLPKWTPWSRCCKTRVTGNNAALFTPAGQPSLPASPGANACRICRLENLDLLDRLHHHQGNDAIRRGLVTGVKWMAVDDEGPDLVPLGCLRLTPGSSKGLGTYLKLNLVHFAQIQIPVRMMVRPALGGNDNHLTADVRVAQGGNE